MNRRNSLKTLAIGSISTLSLLTACGDRTDKPPLAINKPEDYGRTPSEEAHDEQLIKERFFTDIEMATVSVLCDIIIPADSHSGSATEAKVPEFIEFIMKDQPDMQTPVRGGLKWVDMRSFKLFGKPFVQAGREKQMELIELIAYPEKVTAENRPGAGFFTIMRNLTATGFFTSKIGIGDLQYKGNIPNSWDG